MGRPQRIEPKLFTDFCLAARGRPDPPWRSIASRIDFDFVRQEVAELYRSVGNPSVDPAVLLEALAQHEQNTGEATEVATADNGYGTAEVHKGFAPRCRDGNRDRRPVSPATQRAWHSPFAQLDFPLAGAGGSPTGCSPLGGSGSRTLAAVPTFCLRIPAGRKAWRGARMHQSPVAAPAGPCEAGFCA